MADNTARIAEIKAILQTGVDTVTNDGQTTHFDLASLRKELRQLIATDNTNRGRRPIVAQIDLSNV